MFFQGNCICEVLDGLSADLPNHPLARLHYEQLMSQQETDNGVQGAIGGDMGVEHVGDAWAHCCGVDCGVEPSLCGGCCGILHIRSTSLYASGTFSLVCWHRRSSWSTHNVFRNWSLEKESLFCFARN